MCIKYFSSEIVEFPSMVRNITSNNEKLYFAIGNKIYLQYKDRLEVILNDKTFGYFLFASGGMWIVRDWDCLELDDKKSMFLDIFNKDISYSELDYFLENDYACITNEKYVCTHFDKDDECYLIVNSFINDEKWVVKGEFGRVVCNGDFIFIRKDDDDEKSLICYNFELNEMWTVDLANNLRTYNLGYSYRRIYLYESMVIIFVGVDEITRKDGLLCTYSMDDGTEIWRKQINEDPDFISLIDGRIYMNARGKMLVIKPDTGESIMDEPTGFEYGCLTFPYKDNLLVFCESERCIRVFSNDGKTVIQDISIPEPYEPNINELPVVYDGSIYLELSRPMNMLRGASNGLLKLTTTEGEPSIEVKERPPIFMITEEENKKTSYTLITSHNDLEEITRYLQIRLQEIMMLYGDLGSISTDKIDLKHTGKIQIFVDPTELPDNTLDEIKSMVEEVIEWADGINIHPGAGKKYKFKINVSMEIPSNLYCAPPQKPYP